MQRAEFLPGGRTPKALSFCLDWLRRATQPELILVGLSNQQLAGQCRAQSQSLPALELARENESDSLRGRDGFPFPIHSDKFPMLPVRPLAQHGGIEQREFTQRYRTILERHRLTPGVTQHVASRRAVLSLCPLNELDQNWMAMPAVSNWMVALGG